MPMSVRLDTTDARFVDVIHTDGTSIFLLGYGMSQPCGHVDFYPNNGKEQPGCSGTDAPLPLTLIREGLEEASRVLVACSHVRAIKLFTDSINTPCPYIAHKCDSYEHFLEGQLLRVQNEKTILKSNFDPKKETKMIIHGFIDTPLSSWVKEMRRELLKNSDWNVVVVDWAGGSLPLYTQATANTRLVGLEVAYFVNYLQEHMGLDPGKGKCFNCVGNSSNCALMGMHATETPVGPPGSKYYVATGKDSPFCRRHYRITVHLARPPRAESWVQGFMKATIHSENGVARNLDLTPSGYVRLEHGEARSFVVTHPMDMGPVRRAELYWEYDMDVLQPRSLCFFWCNDHLYVSHVQVQRLDMELAGPEDGARGKRNVEPAPQLCTVGSREYADIASRSSATFYDNCGTTKGNRHYTETNEDT
ncbi:hypothetical protein FOCC_FOCC008553 [Frankliniella occidentalis]|nr:hypothetical protein FOCC_FOCC008553 [Frankliniella occidentalis]